MTPASFALKHLTRFVCACAVAAAFCLPLHAQALDKEGAPQERQEAGAEAVYEARYTGLSMGTIVSARLFAKDEATAASLSDAFERQVAQYETLFTVHGSGPLNDVNRQAGRWVGVDCRVAGLVQSALDIAKASDRAFEPTIGALVNVWKIGFGGETRPEQKDIDAALEKVDYTRIAVEQKPGTCRVKIGEGQSIDLGAIAKGWIGTALARDMKKAGAQQGIIDLGGNVSLIGKSPSGRDWRIGVQRPDAERNTILAVVDASDESVITSGDYERKIESGGRVYGHILSPVTGEPALTDLASVTIVDADGARADGWCTALFAMGSDRAIEYAGREKLAVILISSDLKTLWVSRSIAGRVTVLDKSMKIEQVP